MDQLRSVLVAVDFSECSDAALAQACRVAKWNDAKLHVLHVVDELVPHHIAKALKLTLAEAREHTVRHTRERIAAGLAQHGPHGADVHVSFGTPIREFLTKTEEVDADLLVLGVRGLHASPGAGSQASKCVRKVPTRVMLVGENAGGAFKSVVACVDFSETSNEVLRNAARVARRDRCRLNVLHVYHAPWHDLHYRAPTVEASVEFRTEFQAELEATMRDFLSPFEEELQGLDVASTLYDCNSYGLGIVENAKKTEGDLIVIGTRGRTNLRYVLLGSTAERVLKQAPCSVLAIKPRDFVRPS